MRCSWMIPVFVLGVTAVAASAPPAPRYSLTRLRFDPLHYDGATVLGINDSGEMVGVAVGSITIGNQNPFYLSSTASTPVLLQPPMPEPLSVATHATAINEHGQISGHGLENVPLLWENGVPRDLGYLRSDYRQESAAYGINNLGQVTGNGALEDGLRAVLWQEGGITFIGDLPGGYIGSIGRSINDSTVIVGESNGTDGDRAFMWTSLLGMVDLGTLPGHDSSRASDINNDNTIVGTSRMGGIERAFVWTFQDGMQDLGVIGSATSSVANAINASGVVIGYT
jgi:probable HAF family extracellular repeat protein